MFQSYGLNAYREVYLDRGLFISDFILATMVPFIIQFLLWQWMYINVDTNTIKGYLFTDLMFYYAFVIAFNRLNNGYGIVEYFSFVVHTGFITALHCKPISFIKQRKFDFLGGSILYYIPVYSIILYQYFTFKYGIYECVFYIVAGTSIIILSQVLSFYISMMFAMFTLILYRPNFLLSLLSSFQIIMGGVLLPYNFWPDWLINIMRYNPFRFTIAAPAELMTHFSYTLLLEFIMFSMIYIFIFSKICAVLWKKMIMSTKSIGG